MITAIDQMIDLAKIFSSELMLKKNVNGDYLVSIHRVVCKESHNSLVIMSIFGSGTTVESACRDFLAKAKGKLLVGRDPAFYGKKRPEFICV